MRTGRIDLDIPMDFDSLAAAGTMAGSGGVIVLDDSRDMVWALNNINEFYAHESCGQCTPCREGSLWMKKITDRMLPGGGVAQDPDTLKTVADNIAGRTICAFGEACAWPTQSFRREIPRRICRQSAEAGPAADAAGIHVRRIDRESRIATCRCRDPGWEKAGAPEQSEVWEQKPERIRNRGHQASLGRDCVHTNWPGF